MVDKPYVFFYLHSLFFNPVLPYLCELHIGPSYIWWECHHFNLLIDYFSEVPQILCLLWGSYWILRVGYYFPQLCTCRHWGSQKLNTMSKFMQLESDWVGGAPGLAPLFSLHYLPETSPITSRYLQILSYPTTQVILSTFPRSEETRWHILGMPIASGVGFYRKGGGMI